MDPSALEKVSRSLEASLDFWGVMLFVATFAVVVGLVLEYWHEISEFWHHASWPMAAFPWQKGMSILGGVLVTLGVAGELAFTFQASRVESKLRENNHKIEVLLTKEAGDAKRSAEQAADAASRAKNESDAAVKSADEAKNRVVAVDKRADQIDASLRETWFLTAPRRVLYVEPLSAALQEKFKGRDIILTSYAGDQEGWGLCTQLLYVAEKAEMRPKDACGFSPPTVPLVSPMNISGPNVDETVEIAQLLVRVGRITGGAVSAVKGSVLTIFVGAKPNVTIGPAPQTRPAEQLAKKQHSNKRAKH